MISFSITASPIPSDTTDEIIWSASNDNCTVVDGTVTAIKAGDCVITATCGEYNATCNVTISTPVVQYKVNISSKDFTSTTITYDEENDYLVWEPSMGNYCYLAIPVDELIADEFCSIIYENASDSAGNLGTFHQPTISKLGALTSMTNIDLAPGNTQTETVKIVNADELITRATNNDIRLSIKSSVTGTVKFRISIVSKA